MAEVVVPTFGGCMRPWIWPNGMLHVERCSISELRVGDIAVWFDGTNMVSHRVVKLGTDVFETHGDSSAEPDPPVQPSQLLGRAVRFTKGRISYRLDGLVMTRLSLVALRPWAALLAAGRRGRALVRRLRQED